MNRKTVGVSSKTGTSAVYESVVRTLVIDGVTNGEDPEDGSKDRSGGRVLSAEVPSLQSSKVRLSGWSLGEFRVEVDEGGEASSRSSGLYRNQKARNVRRRGTPQRRILATYEESWGCDLRWDDTAKLATSEGGLHNYSESTSRVFLSRRESSCWTSTFRRSPTVFPLHKQHQTTVVAGLIRLELFGPLMDVRYGKAQSERGVDLDELQPPVIA